MKTPTANINLDEEVGHVAEFLSRKWTPINDVQAIIGDIRDVALHAARGWLDAPALWEYAAQLKDERKRLLEKSLGFPPDSCASCYDSVAALLDQVSVLADRIAEAGHKLNGDWNFESRSKSLVRRITSKYPQLVGARPAGSDSLVWVQPNGPGWDMLDLDVDRELFKGAGVTPGFASDLPSSISIHLVRLRGQRASTQLIHAVFTHFLNIIRLVNTEKVKIDLVTALPRLREPTMLFERDDVKTANPFLKVAFELAPPAFTKAQFDKSLAGAAVFDALPDDEKAKKRKEIEEDMVASLDSIDRAAEDEQDAEKTALCRALLAAAFSDNP